MKVSLRSEDVNVYKHYKFSLDGMRIDVIRYKPHTLSLRPFKFFFKQLHWFLQLRSFIKWYEKEWSIKLRLKLWLDTKALSINKCSGYIPRLSLNKTNTVIGWFFVTWSWSNSNVSWLAYNCTVAACVLNTAAHDQCISNLKMAWSSACAHVSVIDRGVPDLWPLLSITSQVSWSQRACIIFLS